MKVYEFLLIYQPGLQPIAAATIEPCHRQELQGVGDLGKRALPPNCGAPMPSYHFNVYEGQKLRDREGTDLSDLQTALRKGIALAGCLLEKNAKTMRLDKDWRMEITDNGGVLLFRLDFTMIGSAAASAIISGRMKA